jgi:glycosyltransferase involved in cell wall biosynthesis
MNGVVRTLQATQCELTRLGHNVRIIGPEANRWSSFAVPFYPEIKLEFFAHGRIARLIRDFAPDCIHIPTEGPLGWAARRVCLRQRRPFTTSYHTRFPEYLAARAPPRLRCLIARITYAVLRCFHAPAVAVMVATPSIERKLRQKHFHRLVRWSRGVDTDLFRLTTKDLAAFQNLPRPVLLCVGRIAIEKNLRDFLDVNVGGSKVVIGDGPDLSALRTRYPHAHFLGSIQGDALARHYAAADLFVFPSTTDTFGLVLLEACSAGLRVAAYPAPGPLDIFADDEAKSFAVLDKDLSSACARALALPDNPDAPRNFAARFSWKACTQEFVAHLQSPSPEAVRRLIRWRKKGW